MPWHWPIRRCWVFHFLLLSLNKDKYNLKANTLNHWTWGLSWDLGCVKMDPNFLEEWQSFLCISIMHNILKVSAEACSCCCKTRNKKKEVRGEGWHTGGVRQPGFSGLILVWIWWSDPLSYISSLHIKGKDYTTKKTTSKARYSGNRLSNQIFLFIETSGVCITTGKHMIFSRI